MSFWILFLGFLLSYIFANIVGYQIGKFVPKGKGSKIGSYCTIVIFTLLAIIKFFFSISSEQYFGISFGLASGFG